MKAHITALQKESKKSNMDFVIIDQKMKRSLTYRQHCAFNIGMLHVIEEFPILCLKNQVNTLSLQILRNNQCFNIENIFLSACV